VVLPSHYWTGPLAALVVLAIVVLICRWVFAAPQRPARARSADRGDYGLLVPVATARTADDARGLSAVLRKAGIRCTVTQTAGQEKNVGGSWQLLVFRVDADRASELVRS
jgi:hypothetical protein